ncbi:hypothetical protein DSO57_1035934 [Entomophthora muscae]|uniref:Uncharacterized protein n=1 Tax=Entomophthora muscae TaxID=34485 RepID=A0ACC2SCT0_9FUNG|nr:hypothetical protein DSO57_1035934 [Entomophthora muscae]
MGLGHRAVPSSRDDLLIGHQGGLQAHEADGRNFVASIWCDDSFGLASFTFQTIILGFSSWGLDPRKTRAGGPSVLRAGGLQGLRVRVKSCLLAQVSRGKFFNPGNKLKKDEMYNLVHSGYKKD